MSFSDGFASGAGVGAQIQQRLLAKELRKLEDERYNEERTYARGRDTLADQRYADEQTYRRGRDTVADQRYGEDRTYTRDRDKIADARADRLYAAGRSDTRMAQLAQALQMARQDRRDAAAIAKEQAQAEYYRSGGGMGAGRAAMGYDEYGPDGELMKRRVPVGAGAGAPQQGGDALSPEAQQLANRIAELQTTIGQQKVAMAQGDNRTGFLNLFSRQGKIDDATAEIGRLRQAQQGMQGNPSTVPGGQPQLPPAAKSALEAEMQRRGFVLGPDGKWAKPQ